MGPDISQWDGHKQQAYFLLLFGGGAGLCVFLAPILSVQISRSSETKHRPFLHSSTSECPLSYSSAMKIQPEVSSLRKPVFQAVMSVKTYARVPWMLCAGTLMMTCWIYMTIYYHHYNRGGVASGWNRYDNYNGPDKLTAENKIAANQRPVPTFAFPKYPPPTRLANLTDFEYAINQDGCAQEDVFMLFLVGSHPRNGRVRDTIRQTLGNPKIEGHTFKVVFMFGNLTNPEWQKKIEEESSTHRDIVQGNFVDSYHNMSYRDIMGLRWAWQFCGQAKYVAHVDDDVSLDVYELTRVLEQRDFGGAERSSRFFMGCLMMLGGRPVRREGKYAVSVEDYPELVYENYCSGWTYVVTPEMAYLLDLAAVRVPTLWLNDAFITGVLVRKLEITQRKLNIASTRELEHMVAMSEQSDELPLNYSLGYVAGNVKLLKTLHRKYEAAHYKRKAS